MVSREIASMANRIKRGGTCNGHASEEPGDVINCKYAVIETPNTEAMCIVFDTYQECLSIVNILIDNFIYKHNLATITSKYVEEDNELIRIYAINEYTITIIPVTPNIEEFFGIDYVSNVVYILGINVIAANNATMFMSGLGIDPMHPEICINNEKYPTVLTKDYFVKNFPDNKLNEMIIKFT